MTAHTPASDDSPTVPVTTKSPRRKRPAAPLPDDPTEVTRADHIEITEGGLETAEARSISIHQGGMSAGYADAIDITQGGIGRAQGDKVSVDRGIVGAAIGGEARLIQSMSQTVVGREATIDQSMVWTVLGGRVTVRQPSAIGVVIAGRVDGAIKPLLDWRGALAFGAAFAILNRILRGRR